MGKLMLINGSPRAPKSNSKKYSEVFKSHYTGEVTEYLITQNKHEQAVAQLANHTDVLFVFPLYADSLPSVFMKFLKVMAQQELATKPTVHVLINCGFIEPEQNAVAVDILKLFCEQNGYPFGSVLCIGGGEAIMGTPFAFLAKQKIKKLATAVQKGKKESYKVTMPLSKKMYLKASTGYWIRYGAQYGVTKEQMETLTIE